jgi:mitochondrial fission protein ELM1
MQDASPSSPTPSAPTLWLLLDDRASHRSQVFGVAQRLGWKFEVKEIRYNRLAMFANVLLGRHLWHLTPEARASLTAPWPDWVIAAGRRSAPAARYIKKRSRGKTRIVHLMWPDAGAASFDLIAIPGHDNPGHKGPNVLVTFGSPHPVTPDTLQSEAKRWERQASRLPVPRIALLVGGSARHAEYEDADFKTLAAYASAEAERLGGSLLISTSPRTGEKGEALVKSLLTVPHLFHSWKPTGDNPFIAFLGLADAIIVTGDSVSMCSEACATGKPVYIFVPPHLSSGKKTFRDALFAGGHAKPHTYPTRLDWQPAPMPDPAGQIAEAIRSSLLADKKE